MNIRLRWVWVIFAAAVLWASAPGQPQAGCPAERFIQNAGSAIMAAARRKSSVAFSGVASRYTDLDAIALFALGSSRASLPRARQAEYIALTRAFVGRFMAKHSKRFAGTSITIVSCSGGGGNLTVNARLSGGQKIVFKLGKGRGGYRVRDLNINAIWLAQQLRSTFTSVIRRNNGDVGALFEYLRSYS